jgi:type I restriction enzyme S subunit
MNNEREFKDLPEGWKWVRLGEVCFLSYGKNLPKDKFKDDGKYKVYGANGVIGFYDRYTHSDLTVLVSCRGEYSGVINIAEPYSFITNNSIPLLIKNQKTLDTIFLYYVLKNVPRSKIVSGSAQPQVVISDLKDIFILNPSLPEQRKIAEILETIDNAIEKTDKIIEKYKRIKQGLMQDLLTKGIDENGNIRNEKTHKFKDSPLGRIPEEWEVVRLGEVALSDGIVRGPFGGMLKKEIFVESGYKVYEQGNAIYKTVNFGYYYINDKKYKQMLRFSVKPMDFIISCSGTIGKIFMIPENFEKGIINQALLKITINDKKFNHKFFEYYFEWEQFQSKIIDYTQGGVMQNLIGINEFKKVNFPLPPFPEQQKIAEILTQTDQTIEKEQQYKEKLQKIKQGLMQDLLTGKVRVNHLVEEKENEQGYTSNFTRT